MLCLADAELAHYVDGILPSEHRSSIEAHIDGCGPCRQILSEAARRTPSSTKSSAVPHAGDRVGRYQLIEPLGAGAMGMVFAAHDPELDRRVAVKLLAPAIIGRLGAPQERLAREARALAKISHPNVVPVFDVGMADHRLFIAMELVDGVTLRATMAARELTMRERRQLLAQAGAGLYAAHAAGVVHRDFKPDNVLVGRDGRVRVCDFGLALAHHKEEERSGNELGPLTVTRTGSLLGTPAYMAPEHLRGERVDAASDQFAFCVTAWEVLLGQRPFVADDAAALLASIEQGPPASPAGSARIDRALFQALQRGLACDPAHRHRDLGTLITLLREPRRLRSSIAAALLGSAVLIGGGALLESSFGSKDEACERAAHGLDAVWNDSVRTHFALMLGGTGQPLAAADAAAATRTIDAWSAAWAKLSVATCRAHRDGMRSSALFDRQQACLSQRRDELASFISLFARADTDPTRAPQVAAELGSLDGCITMISSDAPDVGPDVREQHTSARRAFAAAVTLRKAGRHEEAIRQFEQLLPAVDKLPDRRFGGEILWELAMSERSISKLEAARDHFSAAAARGEEAGDDTLKAKAWLELLSLLSQDVVDLAEAARLEPLARAAVQHAKGSEELRASFAYALGLLEFNRGHFKQAVTALEESLAHHRKCTPLPYLAIGEVTNVLALVHGALGDDARMLQLLDQAKDLTTTALGKDHPAVATLWVNRVEPLSFLGRSEEAMTAAKTAVEIYARAGISKGVDLAAALEQVATLHVTNARYAEALALFERSRAMFEEALGPDHVYVGGVWEKIAAAQFAAGKLSEAAASHGKAIEIWERARGPNHIDLAQPLVGLAKIHLARNEGTAALPLLERAVAIRESQEGDPAFLAYTLFVHGQAVFAATGDPRRTCERMSKAIQMYSVARESQSKSFETQIASVHAWLTEHKLTCSPDASPAR